MSQINPASPLDPGRTITVVSGMPRSGTSMMMQMLEAAGFPIATDGQRFADVDNPKGYYELEVVKRLPKDTSFLKSVVGQVVKVVAPLLRCLPPVYDYRVIFMERDLDEVLASQREMLDRNAGGDVRRVDDEALARAFTRQLREVVLWLAEQENIRTCFVSHRLAVASPIEVSESVSEFLERTGAFAPPLGTSNAKELAPTRMAGVVDASLYRLRRSRKV
jgi:hypothetical protein